MTIYDRKENEIVTLTNYAIVFSKYNDITEITIWPEPSDIKCFSYFSELSPEELMSKFRLLTNFYLNDYVEVIM